MSEAPPLTASRSPSVLPLGAAELGLRIDEAIGLDSPHEGKRKDQ
jgi:hypothetical protein